MDRPLRNVRKRLGLLLALAANLVAWCGVSALLFGGIFDSAKAARIAALLTLVEPIRFGIHSAASGDTGIAVTCLLVTGGALVLLVGAVTRPEHRLIRWLAHVALGAYCFWSLCLLGISV
jgi:hypothetical protein